MILLLFIIILILWTVWLIPRVNKAQEKARRYTSGHRERANGKPFCPKCGSTDLSANNRGYSMITGTIGSKDVYITCIKCGHRWKAGDYNFLYD